MLRYINYISCTEYYSSHKLHKIAIPNPDMLKFSSLGLTPKRGLNMEQYEWEQLSPEEKKNRY